MTYADLTRMEPRLAELEADARSVGRLRRGLACPEWENVRRRLGELLGLWRLPPGFVPLPPPAGDETVADLIDRAAAELAAVEKALAALPPDRRGVERTLRITRVYDVAYRHLLDLATGPVGGDLDSPARRGARNRP